VIITIQQNFWANRFPFVKRFALCYQTVVCLSLLSVTLVYCGQTVGRINMKLGVQIGLGPSHIMLDGDPASPPQNWHSPRFLAHCGQTAGCIKMPLGMEVGLDPGHIVLHGNPAPQPKKGVTAPNFGPCLLWSNSCMYQDTTWYGCRPQTRRHCVRWGSSSPNFRPMSVVAKRLDGVRRHLVRK